MLRALLRLAGAAALAVWLAAPVPAQSPPGFAYDQVAGLLAGATPPPPGDFAAAEALAANAPRRGRAAAGAPRLLRHAFWNGWERVDDPAARSATIWKCDLDQVITLDLARKTYAVTTPAERAAAPPEASGSAQGRLTEVTEALPAVPFGDLPAPGYRTTTTVTLEGASGSCRDGTRELRSVEYLGSRPRPFAAGCPLHDSVPEAAPAFLNAGGCRPLYRVAKSGPVPPARLRLYALLSLPDGTAFLTERGNVRALDEADSSLFEPPEGFTKAP